MQLQKSVDQTLDLQEDTQAYTLRVKNFSANLPIESVTVIEVLPYNDDETNDAKVNRTPASNFTGTNSLKGAVTATDFGGEAALAGTTYYTSIAPGNVPQHLNNDTDASIWFTEDRFGETGAPRSWADVTAFKFVAQDSLATESNVKKSGLILTFETEQGDNEPGDLYANRFTAFSDTFKNEQTGYQLLTSNQTTVRVLGFSLGDLIWIDQNHDGKFDAATDTTAPAGVAVDVYNKQDKLVGSTATNADGRWILNDLAAGDYYAVIPATEFADGGLLKGHVVSTTNVERDANTNLNEGVDHHAIADGDAVRTAGTITLSATVNGSSITGDEPLADNVGSLRVSPLTTDDFTNFTLDMALAPDPGYEFTKTSDPATGSTVNPGDTITYTVTGSNTGLTALNPVTIEDDLTGVLKHAALSGAFTATITDAAGATRDAGLPVFDDVARTLSWEGALAIGETVRLVYAVELNDDAEGVIVNNRASSSATPPGLPPIVPPTVETHHPTPGYTFWKSSNPASENPVAVGESVTYTLSGHNFGETVLNPVTISDDLSEVLAYATLKGGFSATITDDAGEKRDASAPTLTGHTLSWVGALGIGEIVEISYTVIVDDGAEGATLTNTALSTATPPGLPPIEPPHVTTEHPVPGYTLKKSSDPASGTKVKRGATINYTVTGTNTGATVLDPVIINDDLAQVLNSAELSGTPVAVIIDSGGIETQAAAPVLTGTTLNWQGVLAVGEHVELRYSVQIGDEVGKVTIENIVTSTAMPPGGTEIVPPPATTTHETPEPPAPLFPGLPITGENLGIAAGFGVVLLLLGAAVVLRSRRKKLAATSTEV